MNGPYVDVGRVEVDARCVGELGHHFRVPSAGGLMQRCFSLLETKALQHASLVAFVG